MSKLNNPGRAIPAPLTFSQRESIRTLGVALRKLYKSYLKDPPPERFRPLLAKLDDADRRSLSANDA
jgi:Anti-sigma factor NepR